MHLEVLDWILIGVVCGGTLLVGLLVSKRAGSSTNEYFLSGRSMPWWLLGFSMVATTFSADTPNLVTDIVRQNGVSGNWVWWSFLLTGMLTVFVYAKLWRRSEVLTDIEFYELRYGGRPAAFLRGFRALYLGVFFNLMIMATVNLAAIKIGGVMLGFSPLTSIVLASAITVVFTAAGGLRGVLWTDLVLFVIAMVGSIAAAVVVVNDPRVGGLSSLLSHDVVQTKLSLIPALKDLAGEWNWEQLVPILILPLALQWWNVWYPGAEPGGGGYIVQRLLAAKNEKHAVGATLFFNIAHYAIRPWPWILVALASLIVYPTKASIAAAFPEVDPKVIGHDVAYPAMLTQLGVGLRGLVVASLIAAYMSTISTQLNWGTSYVVHDFWRRFVQPKATERELVRVARITTVIFMIASAAIALQLESALDSFQILLQIGAGTGLIFILRWFWWRVNAASEIAAMFVSFGVALLWRLDAFSGLSDAQKLIFGVLVTTVAWIAVALITPPTDDATLRRFVLKVRPGGPGWKPVVAAASRDGMDLRGMRWTVPHGILLMIAGCAAVYGALFGIGSFLYGDHAYGLGFLAVAGAGGFAVARGFRRIFSDA